MNIKAVILDIDGVLVGNIKGVNAPDPHPDITRKLKELVKTKDNGFVSSSVNKNGLLDIFKYFGI